MSKKNEEYEGVSNGAGVHPIPVPEEPQSSTDMLDDIVDALLNPNDQGTGTDPKETEQAENISTREE